MGKETFTRYWWCWFPLQIALLSLKQGSQRPPSYPGCSSWLKMTGCCPESWGEAGNGINPDRQPLHIQPCNKYSHSASVFLPAEWSLNERMCKLAAWVWRMPSKGPLLQPGSCGSDTPVAQMRCVSWPSQLRKWEGKESSLSDFCFHCLSRVSYLLRTKTELSSSFPCPTMTNPSAGRLEDDQEVLLMCP